MPDPEKFNLDKLKHVTMTPWNIHEPKAREVIFREKTEAEAELAKARDDLMREVRRTPFKTADLEAVGHTVGCPKCDHSLQFGYGRTSAPIPNGVGREFTMSSYVLTMVE